MGLLYPSLAVQEMKSIDQDWTKEINPSPPPLEWKPPTGFPNITSN